MNYRILSGVLIFSLSGLGLSSSAVAYSEEFLDSEFLSNQVQIQLLRVTSDVQTGIMDIRLFLDSDYSIQTLRTFSEETLIGEFKVDQLLTGIVFLRQEGRDVVILKSKNFDPRFGGLIELVYLSNGIINTYGKFTMELVRTGDQWELYLNDQTGRKKFTSMYFKGRRFFSRVIGIDKIEVK